MRMVLAFVQRVRLDAVTRALEHVPRFSGMTVTRAGGFGRERMEPHPRTVAEEIEDFTDKVRVETVVHDEQVDEVVGAISRAAHTGQNGDGMVFVLPVERAVRIMTMHEGEAEV